MSNTEEDTYDVSKYSDHELYQLMDLDSPSDRELEAKIHMLIKKYEDMSNAMGRKMHNFFVDIFQHFFETETDGDDDDVQEGFEVKASGNWTQADLSILNTDQNTYDLSKNTLPKVGTKPAATYGIGTAYDSTIATSQIGFQKSVDYTKGTLNPILKETILRIVSIDSQFRDRTNYPYSTDFTFNLSETLQNVVSLKLYSVQIPFTWYTISLSYGSNFFILKPKPGSILDYNGNYDYKIEIPSGNYQPAQLQDAINASIETIKTNHPDVSFGKTGISYNPVNTRATLTVDLQNIYNETNYSLKFPGDPSYNNQYTYGDYTTGTVYTIQQMLGFKHKTVDASSSDTFSVYSRPFLMNDISLVSYMAPNQYFTVRFYDPSLNTLRPAHITAYEYDNIDSDKVSVERWDRLVDPDPPAYDLSGILDNINSSIQSYPQYIDISHSRIQTISLDYQPSGYPAGSYSMLQLSIRLDKKSFGNRESVKAVLDFADASDVWSALRYDAAAPYELSNRYGDVSSAISNFYVNSKPYLYFKCTTPGYDSSGSNDISMTVLPPSVRGYYTLDEYAVAVRKAMTAGFDTSYNRQSTYSFNIQKNYRGIPPQIDVSIQRIIPNKDPVDHRSNFRLNLTQCVLHTVLKYDPYIDLSSNYTFSFKGIVSSATVVRSGPGQNNIIRIESIGTKNVKVDPVVIYLNPPLDTINNSNFTIFQKYINDVFDNSYGDISNNIFMNGTRFKFSSTGVYVDCDVSFNVRALLTDRDYTMYMYDPSGYPASVPTGLWTHPNNTWYHYLKFGQPAYSLTTTSTVRANSLVYNNVIYLNDSNNYFWFTPNELDPKGAYKNKTNDNHRIQIDLSLPVSASLYYTKNEVVDNINQQLSANRMTRGSYLDIDSETTKFRININRNVATRDYQIHFFDQESFTACNFGRTSVQNANQDTTLGWLLGFRDATIYGTTMEYQNIDEFGRKHYKVDKTYYPNTPFTSDISSSDISSNTIANIMTISSDTSISVSLYNYFLLIVDDYTQNHLNDGLVTITSTEQNTALPSYASRNMYKCDPSGNIYVGDQGLTANQIYAANQILNAQPNSATNTKPYYSQGPYVQDIFGIIPMKTAGLGNGQSFIEFGGTLQIQQRMYFGPVNIKRMSIRLLTDKGNLIDLNGANWSFSLIAEQLYTPSKS